MTCPVCDATGFAYQFALAGRRVLRCQGCGLITLEGPIAPAGSTSKTVPTFYMDALRDRGFQKGPVLTSADTSLVPGTYDAAILLDQLQTDPSPGELLRRVHAALKSGAPLLLVVPNVNSKPTGWPQPAERWGFDSTTIQLLLLRHGFHHILVHADRHRLTFTAVQTARPVRPKCSILVAAFNECKTFPILMDTLLKKEIPGVDREIIVIESNSTDGTRALAKQYQAHPEVKLVLQDHPGGKGKAVREGFQHATGDIILIQDADLEYDLNDYEALLAPILAHRALFILGTRHGGDWKIRHFAEQTVLAATMNFGHAFFTGLLNVLYRQNLTDPFTMFKVFRRDCLFGLEFHCNRFDFDHELVIKLVRKGYQPLEVPVNYSSRSFQEGKKVRLFRDPWSWLWVDLKLRFTRIFPKEPG